MHQALELPIPVKIYEFNDEQVRKATELSQNGQQRLHPVSSCETTLFYISTSENGHHGVAQVCISPVKRNDGPNPFYLPILRHTHCCTHAPLGLFTSRYQAVYDVFIRPIQWSFENDMQNITIPAQGTSSACPTCEILREALHSECEFEKSADNRSTTVVTETSVPLSHNSRNSTSDAAVSNDQNTVPQPSTGAAKAQTTSKTARKRPAPNHNEANEEQPRKRKRRSDKEIADNLAEKLIKATKQQTPQTLASIQDAGYLPQKPDTETEGEARLDLYMKMANEIWSLEKQLQKDLKGVVKNKALKWRFCFIASCMWYILRKRRKLLRDDKQDRLADGSHTINMAVNELCKECPCGTKLYAGFASTAHSREKLAGVRINIFYPIRIRVSVTFPENPDALGRDSDGRVSPDAGPAESESRSPTTPRSESEGGPLSNAESLDSYSVLADSRADPINSADLIPPTLHSPYTSLHAFADIAASQQIQGNDGFTTCSHSLASNTQILAIDSAIISNAATSASLHYPEAQNPAGPIRSDQDDEDEVTYEVDDLINWSQPEFPDVSTTLQALISGAYLSNPQIRRKRQLFLHGEGLPPTAYQILFVPKRLRLIRTLAVREMAPKLLNSVQGQLKWRSMLVYIPRGGLCAQLKTYKSIIIPVKTCKSTPALQIQFDWGDERGPARCVELSTLAIIEGAVTFRTVDRPLLVYVVRFFEKDTWPWLASNEDRDRRFGAVPKEEDAVSEIGDSCATHCICRHCIPTDYTYHSS
ncbi:hypothetical protein PG994_015170 [Apiospora phragmitis]|uniref:Uncharacterized protein n=1 Tax=Apiospora phragmitis TaxID=2905665 RepID=A0ABR1SXX4_9PEZI